jgi:predicted flap endonuclease-1-like 5' DNA nuclease
LSCLYYTCQAFEKSIDTAKASFYSYGWNGTPVIIQFNLPGGNMLALSFLSETSHETDLTWLLWLVLAIFVVVVVVGWMSSRKEEAAPVEAHAPAHDEAPAEEVASDPDNLTKLEGIGPKVSGVLAAAGYTTFAGLAAADVDAVREVLKEAGLQMMDPSGWIEQADLAAKGDVEGLAKLQDELKGGRRA